MSQEDPTPPPPDLDAEARRLLAELHAIAARYRHKFGRADEARLTAIGDRLAALRPVA